RVDRLGGGRAFSVDRLPVGGSHAPPIVRDGGRIVGLHCQRVDVVSAILARGREDLDTARGRAFHTREVQVPAIGQVLTWNSGRAPLNLLLHRLQLVAVTAGVSRAHPYDDAAFGVGGELQVVGGSEATVAQLH